MSEPPDETRSGDPVDPGETKPYRSPSQPRPQEPPQVAYAGQPFAPAPAVATIPRDRLAVHLTWEGILLVLTAVVVGGALASTQQAHLDDILRPVGYSGLIAAGLALSLRTSTPNLAVGSIAMATGVVGAHFVATAGWSLWPAMAAAAGIALAAGLITGVIVAALSVPSWAATLALALLAQAAAVGISSGQPIVYNSTTSYSSALWLVVFAVVSIGGGALWLAPPVRTALSATRSAGDPGRWGGLTAGLGAVAGLAGSSLLAGLGGVALVIYLRVGDPSTGGINLTLIALAAVLAGGVSVFGRRAGIFGTVLGVVLAQTLLFLVTVHALPPEWVYVPIAGLIVLGLCVSRAVEGITDVLNLRRAPGSGIVPCTGFATSGSVAPPGG